MATYYERQRDMQLNTDISVFIVGLGGVGFNVGLQLAMSGVNHLYLVDHDFIEPHNLNRIPVTPQDVGQRKVEVLKNQIQSMRPDAHIVAFAYPFREMMIPGQIDWLVDCTDRFRVQKENYSIARSRGMNYCKLGYDGDYISIFSAPAQWDMEEEEEAKGKLLSTSCKGKVNS